MLKMLKSFIKDESGIETVEYAIMLALLIALAYAGGTLLFGNVDAKMNEAATFVNDPAAVGP